MLSHAKTKLVVWHENVLIQFTPSISGNDSLNILLFQNEGHAIEMSRNECEAYITGCGG